MSEWILPKAEDINLSKEENAIHIWIESDDFGNRYISIEGETLEFLKKLVKEMI